MAGSRRGLSQGPWMGKVACMLGVEGLQSRKVRYKGIRAPHKGHKNWSKKGGLVGFLGFCLFLQFWVLKPVSCLLSKCCGTELQLQT